MHELSVGITTNNYFSGPSRNFYNFDYTCLGSSGGSGGVVGADIVPVALGVDTGGSIRLPAHALGAYGFRPSDGRWPTDRLGLHLSKLRDAVGPITRSAEDVALLDQVVQGSNDGLSEVPPLKGLRIGIPQ